VTGETLGRQGLAARLEFANLAVDAREADIRLLCLEAERIHVPVIVVNPVNVALAASHARSAALRVTAAVAYPVGAYPPEIKALEVEDAIANGADEIMMLMAVGPFVEGLYQQTEAEMAALVRAAGGRTTKLIVEVGALNPAQKVLAARMAAETGIDTIVTSTGFTPGGFPQGTADDVALLAGAVGGGMGVIAAGHIDSSAQARALLEAGAARVCTLAWAGIRRELEEAARAPGGSITRNTSH
jgi:deoxyribose-phosphate aldolase